MLTLDGLADKASDKKLKTMKVRRTTNLCICKSPSFGGFHDLQITQALGAISASSNSTVAEEHLNLTYIKCNIKAEIVVAPEKPLMVA